MLRFVLQKGYFYHWQKNQMCCVVSIGINFRVFTMNDESFQLRYITEHVKFKFFALFLFYEVAWRCWLLEASFLLDTYILQFLKLVFELCFLRFRKVLKTYLWRVQHNFYRPGPPFYRFSLHLLYIIFIGRIGTCLISGDYGYWIFSWPLGSIRK